MLPLMMMMMIMMSIVRMKLSLSLSLSLFLSLSLSHYSLIQWTMARMLIAQAFEPNIRARERKR
jgi:hypothetical protein